MPNELRPPKKWWDKCMDETNNARLCAWVYWHHLKPAKPKDKEEPDEPETRAARTRKRAWLKQKGKESFEIIPPKDYTPNEEKWQQAIEQAKSENPELDDDEILIKAVKIYTQNSLQEKIHILKFKLG